jgi:predicted nucleotide-binding protein with TIR-like domain
VKPTLFIGSSRKRLPIANALKETLTDCADVTVWNKAPEFALGESILDGLIKVAQLYDFALLIFGQDDPAMMDGKTVSTVRDNVIFELGLFMGNMGNERAFWLSPRGDKSPSVSSDLEGIVHLRFDEPDLADAPAIIASLQETRDKIHEKITTLGIRTNRTSNVVPIRRALCLASSEYAQERFKQDIEDIHSFFSTGEVTSKQGVTASSFYDYLRSPNKWDMIHLGLYVDNETQRLLFDKPSEAGEQESLPVQAIEGMIKDCGAVLVVIITCDSLRFGEQLARFTNVIAGYQTITPTSALSWGKVFYHELAAGIPLSQAFDKAQDVADPGLVLLARRDIRFRTARN